MNIDGSDKRQITRLGAMSWAPFYHPSGQYLIFTTNRHGFANFELYLIDVEGKSTPVRVTYTKGFDGLPAFTPDGEQLAWTSSRTASGQSQLFLASWNHDACPRIARLGCGRGEWDRANSPILNKPSPHRGRCEAGRRCERLCGVGAQSRRSGVRGCRHRAARQISLPRRT